MNSYTYKHALKNNEQNMQSKQALLEGSARLNFTYLEFIFTHAYHQHIDKEDFCERHICLNVIINV